MNTTVVICSANRPGVLSETVQSLVRGQSLAPRAIIVSVFNPEHVAESTKAHSSVRVVVSGRQGLTAQRNAALGLVQTRYTLFLDDDVEVAPNFIESMERLLDKAEDAVIATGFVVIDGVEDDTGLDRELAQAAVANYVQGRDNCDREEAYGCNLFVRTVIFDKVLFDENLPLYGWLEDLDFSTKCRRYGRIVLNAETCVAHLATPAGRMSGLSFGYSQIVNPFYLWKKNRRPRPSNLIFAHWLIALGRNLRRILIRIPSDRSDRAGRFQGNIIALCHLLAGKADPSYIVQLQEAAEAENAQPTSPLREGLPSVDVACQGYSALPPHVPGKRGGMVV